MAFNEKLGLKEAVKVASPAAKKVESPHVGKAVLVCLACGSLLCEPYPAASRPKVVACHGEAAIREDYAPTVRVRFDGVKMVAIAGEPMAHVRARGGD